MTEKDYCLATNLARLYEIHRMLVEMVFVGKQETQDTATRRRALGAVDVLLQSHKRALGING